MGGRHKNFEDPILVARDMTWAIFQKGHFYCSTLYIENNNWFDLKGVDKKRWCCIFSLLYISAQALRASDLLFLNWGKDTRMLKILCSQSEIYGSENTKYHIFLTPFIKKTKCYSDQLGIFTL
jgi:hypothetical protein